MPPRKPVRRRNAVATREAILLSARRAFARAGYDGAGVREIAREAGVTAMLVNRYFGSKEKLFAEVVVNAMSAPIILTAEHLRSPDMGAEMAAALVAITAPEQTPLDGFLITLHSSSSKVAARIGRKQIENHHQKVMTAALKGELAAERAALFLSLVSGFQVMRQMIGLTALTKADPEVLKQLLAPLIQQLVSGTPARR